MKKKNLSKLTLSRETLHSLEEHKIAKVVAGTMSTTDCEVCTTTWGEGGTCCAP